MKISFVELENYYPIQIAKWLENAFRRFESVVGPEMPEMHLQNFEKLQSQKIALRCLGILGQGKSLEISVILILLIFFSRVDRGNQHSFDFQAIVQ